MQLRALNVNDLDSEEFYCRLNYMVRVCPICDNLRVPITSVEVITILLPVPDHEPEDNFKDGIQVA